MGKEERRWTGGEANSTTNRFQNEPVSEVDPRAPRSSLALVDLVPSLEFVQS